MNLVTLIGNLVKDPELTQTANSVSVCKFSLAVNRPFANAEGVKECDFLQVITWRALAENCDKFLKKGKKCAIVGRIQTRAYDKEDGSRAYITEIIAENVEFLSPKAVGESDNLPEPPPEKKATPESPQADGLPF